MLIDEVFRGLEDSEIRDLRLSGEAYALKRCSSTHMRRRHCYTCSFSPLLFEKRQKG